MSFSLETIDIYNIVILKVQVTLMGPPEGKCLKIDTASQNRLNTIRKS